MKKVHDFYERFKFIEIAHVPEEQNFKADIMSKLTSLKRTRYNCTVIHETVTTPSIEEGKANIIVVAHLSNWMTPIIHFPQSYESPCDELEAKKICKRAKKYILMGGKMGPVH